MLNEILEDAETPLAPADSAIKKIALLASVQLRIERRIAQLNDELEEETQALRDIAERALPTAMSEAGVNAFELSDGSKITVKPFYGASITDENRQGCFGWLEENGHGPLIKREVTATPPRNDTQAYLDLKIFLEKAGLGYKTKESVHQGTLTAFVKEQLETGKVFPMDLFKVFSGKKAIIKEAK